jgi:hypothetical protein
MFFNTMSSNADILIGVFTDVLDIKAVPDKIIWDLFKKLGDVSPEDRERIMKVLETSTYDAPRIERLMQMITRMTPTEIAMAALDNMDANATISVQIASVTTGRHPSAWNNPLVIPKVVDQKVVDPKVVAQKVLIPEVVIQEVVDPKVVAQKVLIPEVVIQEVDPMTLHTNLWETTSSLCKTTRRITALCEQNKGRPPTPAITDLMVQQKNLTGKINAINASIDATAPQCPSCDYRAFYDIKKNRYTTHCQPCFMAWKRSTARHTASIWSPPVAQKSMGHGKKGNHPERYQHAHK